MKKSIILEIICALLIFLFVYAAFSKLLVFDEFEDSLHSSPLIGRFGKGLAWTLPAVELLIALMLLLPGLKLPGLYLSVIILSSFSVYLLYIVIFWKHHLPCSCGGILRTMTWKQHIIFNCCFIILSVAGILNYKSRENVCEVSGNPWSDY